jgi:hypothetical protein
MDVYTLSNMFSQSSQQIITYTGEKHMETYTSFLRYLDASLIAQYSTNSDDRCVPIRASAIPNFNEFKSMKL